MSEYQSDRINAEEELRNFKFAVSQHSIVAVTDKAGRITFVNDKFCELSQYSEEEILGQDHRIINSGHHPKSFFQDLYKTIHAGEVWKGEIKNKAKDGSFYWVATTITPIKNQEGAITEFIAIRTDITENKTAEEKLIVRNLESNKSQKALKTAIDVYHGLNSELTGINEELAIAKDLLEQREKELAEANTRFSMATNAAKIGIWDRDLVNDYSHWDDTLYTLYGIKDTSIDINESKVWRSAIHPDDLEDTRTVMRNALKKDKTYEIAYRVVWEDQSIHYLQANAIIHRDSSGNPIRLIGTMMDVTEQKLAAKALRESEQALALSNTRFQLAADAAKIGISDRDLVNNVTLWDDTVYALLGIADKNSIDLTDTQSWDRLVHPDDLKNLHEIREKAVLNDGILNTEFRVIWEDKTIHHLKSSGTAQRDPSGKAIRLISTIMDVTDEKLAEKALRERKEKYKRDYLLLEESQAVAKLGGWQLDVPKGELYWTAETYRIHETSPDEFNPTVDAGVGYFLPESKRIISEALEKAMTTGEGYDLHLETYTTKGSRIHVRTTCAVTMEGGKPVKLTGIFQDITEQRQAQQELELSNTRLSIATESGKIGIWEYILDDEGNLIWDVQTYAIYGISKDTFDNTYDAWRSAVHPEDLPEIERTLEDAITHKTIFDKEFRVIWPDKSIHHIRAFANILYDDKDKPIKLIGANYETTQQKNRELKIEEFSTRLSLATDAAKIGIWELIVNSGRLIWDEQMLELHGITFESFDGSYENWRSMVHPDDLDSLEIEINEHIKEKRDYEGEYRVIWPDKSIHHIRSFGKLVHDKSGELVKIIGTNYDVTDRVERQMELEEFGTRLSLATESASIGIWEYFIEENSLIWDDQNCALFGLTKETFSGNYEGWKYTVHPEDIQQAEQKINDAIANNSILNVEFRAIWPDKSIHYIGAFGQSVTDHTGKVVKLIGTNYDITDRVERQMEIEASNTLLNVAKDAAKIGIWEYFIDDQSLIWDDKMFEIFDVPKNVFSGTYEAWAATLHPEDLERSEQELESSIATGENFESEFRIIWQDKSIHHIKGLANFVSDTNGKRIKMIGVNYDITDRIEKEIELLKAKEKAEENDRLKSAFLANMRHEIRNPLNVIMGFSKQVMAPDITDADRGAYSKIVINSSKQLLAIIDDITAISLLETKQEHINKSDVNINDLLTELKKQFTSQAQTRDLELTLTCPLPDEQSVIATDRSKLTRIITNFLTNALKFTHHGFVKFGYEIKDETIIFFVEDSGIGVAQDHQEQIFGSFQQADISVSRKYGGTGLGLSISKGLIEILGGEIWFESELNKGSKFYISLPFNPNNPISHQPEIAQNTESKNTILIAEDQAINFHYLKILIQRKFKYEILHALNGEEAVDLFKSNPSIALVLMDINMPVMDGFDAATDIKKMNSNTPIIAQTGYDIVTNEKYSPEIFDDYVSKPIDEELLLTKIAAHSSTELQK